MSTLLALDNGRIVAYLMLARGRNKPGFVEGGGDAGALEALYHQALVLGTAGDSAFAVVPLTPTTFGDVLEARKPGTSVLDTESDIGFQMMRVNSHVQPDQQDHRPPSRAKLGGRGRDGVSRVQGRRQRCDDHPAEWGRGSYDGTLRGAGRADAQGAYEAHIRTASGWRTGHG